MGEATGVGEQCPSGVEKVIVIQHHGVLRALERYSLKWSPACYLNFTPIKKLLLRVLVLYIQKKFLKPKEKTARAPRKL